MEKKKVLSLKAKTLVHNKHPEKTSLSFLRVVWAAWKPYQSWAVAEWQITMQKE